MTSLRCFGERIEIYCNDAKEWHIVFRRLSCILFTSQDTAKDVRMKCLDAPPHNLGETGDFGNWSHLQSGFTQCSGSAVARNQFPVCFRECCGELD